MSRLRLFVTLPLLLIVVLFAVMNHGAVQVEFWPLPWHPRVPLYAIAFGAYFLGILSGGLAVWLGGVRKRRRERQRVAAVATTAESVETPPRF